MKYALLAGLLGVEAVNLKAGIFGGKPFASFDEEALEKIESALQEKDTSGLTEQVATLTQEAKNTTDAVTAALELNELAVEENASVAEQIKALGTKCKEYGEKKTVHTAITNDGKETDLDDGLIEGYIDPNAEHNKLLNSI